MDNQKLKVFIAYSPGKGEIADLANRIAEKCEAASVSVSIKAAGEATVPEINAADILVFGAEEEGAVLQEGGFRDFFRAFTGINFAGKRGALFSYSMQTAVDGLKEMLKDTELSLPSPGLIYTKNGKSVNDKKVDKWINQTLTTRA